MSELIRLLRCDDDGDFSLEAFASDKTIPPYAILSHTWEPDQEVTYQDLMAGTGTSKTGYNKIRLCAQQARRENLHYCWVDTCCINKSNPAELQKAINSMFRWYKKAEKCYVYLQDVTMRKRKSGDRDAEYTWESTFRQSRWFQRGWTLQELLAPSSIIFFSQEWKEIGDKLSLVHQIHEATGIPNTALQGAPLYQFTDNERFLWIQHRETTVKEDKVYALLGIFDIQMPLCIGEGYASAFKRLQEEISKLNACLQDLRSTDPHNDKIRIEDTKGGLLVESYRWILETPIFQQWKDISQSRLLCINGDPGKGKTMLLCGIINELNASMERISSHVCYFFCQSTESRINSATAVLRGLLYMLVSQQPSLISHIQKKYNVAGRALFEDTNAWVALREIFTSVLLDPNLETTYLLVDALDECEVNQDELLDFIAQQSSASSRVKWIVSSRNWPNIEERLAKASQGTKLSLELNEESVSAAVDFYVKRQVLQLSEIKNYDVKTIEAVTNYLSSNANGTFLWVALVCQSLDKVAKRNVMKKLTAFPPGLESLYQRMMQQILDSDDADICQKILALSTTVYQPVTLMELVALVEELEEISDDREAIQDIINHCGSFLTLRDSTVYFVHQSAKDFLLSKASDDIFHYRPHEAHRIVFFRSLAVMSNTLCRDMYNLHRPGYLIDQIKPPDPNPLDSSHYSCVYWIDHLCDSMPPSSVEEPFDPTISDSITGFIEQNYIYWLEALSLCRAVRTGVASMKRLEVVCKENDKASPIHQLVQDAYRFIMYHKESIEIAPLQAYMSALIFNPTGSLTKRLFAHEAPNDIVIRPGLSSNWSACLHTLDYHHDVLSVAFSHDSARLASASPDGTVKLWDVSTGVCLKTLEGHLDVINSVVFSHISTQLATGSDDATVKIWNTATGRCLKTLRGHIQEVESVIFCYDSSKLASLSHGFRDDYCEIMIWDIRTGECLQKLDTTGHPIKAIAFLPNSTQMISAQVDGTIHIWDIDRGECLQMVEGYDEKFRGITFSHDRRLVAGMTSNDVLMIWDANRANSLQMLSDHGDYYGSVAFSHDSMRLASSTNNGITIWDTKTGEFLYTLKDHDNSRVKSLAYSHNSAWLASASIHEGIKIWDTDIQDCLDSYEGHIAYITVFVLSHNLEWLASGSEDRTVRLWDVKSGKCFRVLEGNTDWIFKIVFSHDSMRLASASMDHVVRIWDTSSGTCLTTLKNHCSSLEFLYNSMWLALGLDDGTAKILDAISGECLQTLEGHTKKVLQLKAISYDSKWLASMSLDRTIKIWDASSGKCLQTFGGFEKEEIRCMNLNNSSTLLASSMWWQGQVLVRIWDINSGACLLTLKGLTGSIVATAFSPDSKWLASSSIDSTVKIWDVNGGACLHTIEIGRVLYSISFDTSGSYLHTDIGTLIIDISDAANKSDPATRVTSARYSGLGLSSDLKRITYDSENLVWLPLEYRPLSCSVLERAIAIVDKSNNVRIFDCDKLIDNRT
ncbi:unnamed protein product [Periconia digitata]|uniref:NACHT domain-containing protein n=1 Tax=Periconia digitata TaxID=1303443 RepID=A0A9W4XU59_9PLEO|nr:unnamed protein product [Periconia digitata]